MPEVFHDVMKFLSTPSARRATNRPFPDNPDKSISIHALREEGDKLRLVVHGQSSLFLSTPSARRATPLIRFYVPHDRISIHALREEGDTIS